MKTLLHASVLGMSLIALSNTLFADESINLKQTIQLALENHPNIVAGEYYLQASEKQLQQSKKYDNPTISIEREDFGLSSPEQAKTRLGLSMPINWVERRARAAIASIEKDSSRSSLQSAKAQLIKDVSHQFITTLGEQEQQKLIREEVSIAKSVLEIVKGRAQAGRISPVEETKAALTLNQARLQEQDINIALNRNKQKLKELLLINSKNSMVLQNDLSVLTSLPELESFLQQIPSSLAYQRWTIEAEKQGSMIQHAQAEQWPEISFTAGVTQFETDGKQAMDIALDIELPILDRNTAQIDAEKAKLLAIKTERKNLALQLRQNIIETYFNWQSALSKLNTLKKQIIPQAQEIFDSVQDSYTLGKLTYLDVLDAERSLVAARKQYIGSTVNYHHAKTTMDFLLYSMSKE